MRKAMFCLLIISLVVPASADISLVGDKDGFGVGCPIVGGLHFTDYGAYWGDYRTIGDPDFTDVWETGIRSWTQNYTVGSPMSASLELFLAGIADYGTWSADIVFDGTTIGTLPGVEGWHDVTRLVSFDVPIGLLDGSSAIQIAPSSSGDGYIVDFAELTIQAVPAPAALLLGTLGLSTAGLRLRRMRR